MAKVVNGGQGALINNRFWSAGQFGLRTPEGKFGSGEQLKSELEGYNLELSVTARRISDRIIKQLESGVNSTKLSKDLDRIAAEIAKLKTNRTIPMKGVKGVLTISTPSSLQIRSGLRTVMQAPMLIEAMHNQWGFVLNIMSSELMLIAKDLEKQLNAQFAAAVEELAYIDPILFEVLTGSTSGEIIEREPNTNYQRTGLLEDSFQNVIRIDTTPSNGAGYGISLVVDLSEANENVPYWIYVDQGHRINLWVVQADGKKSYESALMPARDFIQGAVDRIEEYIATTLVPELQSLYGESLENVAQFITKQKGSSKVSMQPDEITNLAGSQGFFTKLLAG